MLLAGVWHETEAPDSLRHAQRPLDSYSFPYFAEWLAIVLLAERPRGNRGYTMSLRTDDAREIPSQVTSPGPASIVSE
jgi:hypothetical protein